MLCRRWKIREIWTFSWVRLIPEFTGIKVINFKNPQVLQITPSGERIAILSLKAQSAKSLDWQISEEDLSNSFKNHPTCQTFSTATEIPLLFKAKT